MIEIIVLFSLIIFLALEGRINSERVHSKQTSVLYEIRDLLKAKN